jgi:hypothetical protein
MRVWTIQPLGVWRSLCRQGSLQVSPDALKYGGYIPPAYEWLQSQLAKRLSCYTGHLPWWVYCQKPDLRRHRHALRSGVVGVRLELEVSEASLLTFPSWAWHQVFCEDYLALTREEYDQWMAGLRRACPDEDVWPPPEPWRSQVEASWERLFSAELPSLSWNWDYEWARKPSTEGVLETIRLDDVRRVRHFSGTLKEGSRSRREQ